MKKITLTQKVGIQGRKRNAGTSINIGNPKDSPDNINLGVAELLVAQGKAKELKDPPERK